MTGSDSSALVFMYSILLAENSDVNSIRLSNCLRVAAGVCLGEVAARQQSLN